MHWTHMRAHKYKNSHKFPFDFYDDYSTFLLATTTTTTIMVIARIESAVKKVIVTKARTNCADKFSNSPTPTRR